MIGKQFGRWVVLEKSDRRGRYGHSWWLCRCSCGTEREIEQGSILSGDSRSCGCLKREVALSRAGAMEGLRFGNLTVLDRVISDRKGAHWRCRCDCGSEHVARATALRDGHTTSCGCARKFMVITTPPVSIGDRFHRLEIVSAATSAPKQGRRWVCRCDCGEEVTVRAKDLKNGNTKSCGCMKKERQAENGLRMSLTAAQVTV